MVTACDQSHGSRSGALWLHQHSVTWLIAQYPRRELDWYCTTAGGCTVNYSTTALGFSARKTADWSSCSRTDSGMTVVLRDDAKVTST